MANTTTTAGFNYPHRVLTPNKETPGYSSLQKLQKELYANAQAMHSNAGGGNHGHLALVMPHADYLALAGQVFTIPQHPGNLPVHAVGATSPQITETNRQYDANLAAYMHCKEVDAALWEQILTTVNKTFVVASEHEELGRMAMPQIMLAHLKEEYGELDATEIKTNRAKLAGAWNPDDHIEDLFIHIRDAQRLAAKAMNPILMVLPYASQITALENTGVFESALELWHLKPDADKTIDNF
jgi:hypothetical protein